MEMEEFINTDYLILIKKKSLIEHYPMKEVQTIGKEKHSNLHFMLLSLFIFRKVKQREGKKKAVISIHLVNNFSAITIRFMYTINNNKL